MKDTFPKTRTFTILLILATVSAEMVLAQSTAFLVHGNTAGWPHDEGAKPSILIGMGARL